MSDQGREHILRLTDQDLRMLTRAMKAYRGKLARDHRRSTFVPEPGRANVTENNLMHVTEKLEAFEELLRG